MSSCGRYKTEHSVPRGLAIIAVFCAALLGQNSAGGAPKKAPDQRAAAKRPAGPDFARALVALRRMDQAETSGDLVTWIHSAHRFTLALDGGRSGIAPARRGAMPRADVAEALRLASRALQKRIYSEAARQYRRICRTLLVELAADRARRSSSVACIYCEPRRPLPACPVCRGQLVVFAAASPEELDRRGEEISLRSYAAMFSDREWYQIQQNARGFLRRLSEAYWIDRAATESEKRRVLWEIARAREINRGIVEDMLDSRRRIRKALSPPNY